MRNVSTLLLLLLLGVASAEDKKDKDRPALKLSADEKALVELLNKARAKEKLPALTINATLCAVARKHSANMAKNGKLAHELDGKKPKDRVTDAGYDYRSMGENIAWADEGSDNTPPKPADVHEMWMKSKVHKDNIVASKYTEIGIGIVRGPKGDWYYTQVFGRPRKK